MKRVVATSAALAITLASSLATAGDADDLQALLGESMQSTASKTTETSSVAPATSVVLTADDLRLFGVTSVSEALALLSPGVVGVEGVDTTHIGVRGTLLGLDGGSHILWLLNGHRMNEPYGGSALTAMPIELVDRVEVVLGPGSVLYGSNAMQGVVNIVTKEVATFSRLRAGVEGMAPLSVRPWVGGAHAFELFGTRGQIVGGAQYQTQNNTLMTPRVSLGNDPNTGRPYRFSRAVEGDGFWGGPMRTYDRQPSGVLRITLGDVKIGLHAAMWDRSTAIDPSDFNADSRLVERTVRFDVEHTKRWTPVISTTARVYADVYDQRARIETSRAPGCIIPNGTCRLDNRAEVMWGGTELQGHFDWLRNGTFVTMLGSELVLRKVRTILDIEDVTTDARISPSSGIVDRSIPQLSGYGQQTWSPFRWLDLNAGMRLDYDPRFSPVVSPREAIRVAPWGGGAFKLIHSEAYRAPTFRESFLENALVPIADDLKPERARSFELSFQQAFGGQRLRFSAFQSKWQNLISLVQLTPQQAADLVAEGKSALPPLYQYRNVKSIDTRGFEVSWEGSLITSRLKHVLNVTNTLSDSNGQPLDGAPRFFGNARLSYDLGGNLPTIGVVTTFYSKAIAAESFDRGYDVPPYAPPQLVARVVAAGRFPGIPRLTYRGYLSYAFADRSPMNVGPAIAVPPTVDSPLLAPVERVKGLVGVAYEF